MDRVCVMSLIDDSVYWSARANEARISADCMVDAGCRYILLNIAKDYDQLRQWFEGQDSVAANVDEISARHQNP